MRRQETGGVLLVVVQNDAPCLQEVSLDFCRGGRSFMHELSREIGADTLAFQRLCGVPLDLVGRRTE